MISARLHLAFRKSMDGRDVARSAGVTPRG
jgi:hypothetical protein